MNKSNIIHMNANVDISTNISMIVAALYVVLSNGAFYLECISCSSGSAFNQEVRA